MEFIVNGKRFKNYEEAEGYEKCQKLRHGLCSYYVNNSHITHVFDPSGSHIATVIVYNSLYEDPSSIVRAVLYNELGYRYSIDEDTLDVLEDYNLRCCMVSGFLSYDITSVYVKNPKFGITKGTGQGGIPIIVVDKLTEEESKEEPEEETKEAKEDADNPLIRLFIAMVSDSYL